MVTVVYVDILIIFNTLVNYLIILATAFFTSERKRRGRIALSAFLCSGLSLIVLVPNIGEVLLVVIKLLGATVMAGAAFGFKGIKRLSRNAIYVFISSYVFAGLLYSVKEWTKSRAIIVNNHTVYVGASPLFMIICLLSVYVLLSAAELLFKRPKQIGKTVRAKIVSEGGTLEFDALIDSGNKLRASASGDGVIVLKKCFACKLVDPYTISALEAFEAGSYDVELLRRVKGFSLIPFSTIARKGMLLGFRGKCCTVTANGKPINIDRPVFAFARDGLVGGADGILSYDELFTE